MIVDDNVVICTYGASLGTTAVIFAAFFFHNNEYKILTTLIKISTTHEKK